MIILFVILNVCVDNVSFYTFKKRMRSVTSWQKWKIWNGNLCPLFCLLLVVLFNLYNPNWFQFMKNIEREPIKFCHLIIRRKRDSWDSVSWSRLKVVLNGYCPNKSTVWKRVHRTRLHVRWVADAAFNKRCRARK